MSKAKLKRRKQRKQIKRWLEEASEMLSQRSGVECELKLKPEVQKEINEKLLKKP